MIYTKPRNEKKISERLVAKGFEVYCPLVTTVRHWSDRKKTVKVPMFTSYVFARVAEMERVSILEDPGVLNFVYWQSHPAVVRQQEIEAIRKIEQHGLDVEVSGHRPSKGESIEITEGPFKGLSGEVRKLDKRRLSVWVESIKSLVTFNYQLNNEDV